MIARNADRRKGTRIASAARIPATTITNAATVTKTRTPWYFLLFLDILNFVGLPPQLLRWLFVPLGSSYGEALPSFIRGVRENPFR